MKYFTPELLSDMFDFDKTQEERDIAEQQWNNNCRLYTQEREKLKDRLPKKIYEALKSGFFHDASIESISFLKNHTLKQKTKFDIIIKLLQKEKNIELTYHDVSCFSTTIDFSEGYVSFGDYQYGEILEDEEKWIHNFLFFNDSEINIKCEKITWKEIK